MKRVAALSAHLISGVLVAAVVVAMLALRSLVTIEGATVTASPTRLKVGVSRQCSATLGLLLAHVFLLRGSLYSQGHLKPAKPIA
jgi:hypothetical protein